MHRILRNPDLHATLSRPSNDASASDDVSNSKRPGLTICVVEATERYLSVRQCTEFPEIRTYSLRYRGHRKVDQQVTMHRRLGDRDLQPRLSRPQRWISKRRCVIFEVIGTYRLGCRGHRKMDQRATLHRILGGPDLQSMLSRPPKDGSASNHASNYKRSGLTSYVAEAIEGCISEQWCIEF